MKASYYKNNKLNVLDKKENVEKDIINNPKESGDFVLSGILKGEPLLVDDNFINGILFTLAKDK
jgi:hypothetical protein